MILSSDSSGARMRSGWRRCWGKRMERFGLRLHPEKTRLIAFERPKAGQRSGKGPGTFDFSGVHDVLATDAARTLADVVQDAEQGPEAIQSNGLRMVSAPPASTGRGPARSAQEDAWPDTSITSE